MATFVSLNLFVHYT